MDDYSRQILATVAASRTALAVYGSASGLSSTSDQFWHQDVNGVEGSSGSGDVFGRFLTAGDFDGNGSDDLAVGVPLEDLASGSGILVDASGVNILYGSNPYGLTAIADQMWTQTFILPPQPGSRWRSCALPAVVAARSRAVH